jgi:non-heme chloroperoxidase
MPYLQTSDETCLFYRDWGQGGPVVFLASAGFSCDIWQYQMAELSRDVRCVGYDRRGHGRSDEPGRGYDYNTLADDLASLISHLDLREATLVGHSMAGGEIVRYLTRHGAERIAGLVLVAATLPFPLRTVDNPDGVDNTVTEQIRAGWYQDLPRWIAEAAPAFFGEGLPINQVSTALREWGIAEMARTSLRALLDCNRTMLETDFRQELRKVCVPTLVIHGDHDASTPIEISGRKTASLVSGSVLKVYDNGPHGLMFTHTEQLNGDLRAFVTR